MGKERQKNFLSSHSLIQSGGIIQNNMVCIFQLVFFVKLARSEDKRAGISKYYLYLINIIHTYPAYNYLGSNIPVCI